MDIFFWRIIGSTSPWKSKVIPLDLLFPYIQVTSLQTVGQSRKDFFLPEANKWIFSCLVKLCALSYHDQSSKKPLCLDFGCKSLGFICRITLIVRRVALVLLIPVPISYKPHNSSDSKSSFIWWCASLSFT